MLRPLGFGDIEWATHHPTASVVMVLVWQWTPFTMLIILAGLQSQSRDILEAARVDGANSWNIFIFLTLPHLRQYLELAIVLASIYVVQTFDPIFLITQGGPGDATTNLPYYLYLKTFRATNIGLSAAAGVLFVLATIVISTLILRSVASVFRQEALR